VEGAPYGVAAAWPFVRVPAVVAPKVLAMDSSCPEVCVSAALLMYKRAILAAYGIWAGVPLDPLWTLPHTGVTQLWNDPAALVCACSLRCLQWRSIARRLQRWWRKAILRKRSIIAAIVIQRAWRNHCPLSSYLSTLRATIEATNDQVAVSFGLCLDAFIERALAPVFTDRAG
jgi:hypothetical protein